MLGSDEMRAWYGPDHVRFAADRGAVGTLLISDELFRYENSHRNLDRFSYPQVQGKGSTRKEEICSSC